MKLQWLDTQAINNSKILNGAVDVRLKARRVIAIYKAKLESI